MWKPELLIAVQPSSSDVVHWLLGWSHDPELETNHMTSVRSDRWQEACGGPGPGWDYYVCVVRCHQMEQSPMLRLDWVVISICIAHSWICQYCVLSHDQDTIRAEKGCAEMHNFCVAALMFLAGHGIKARTHAHTEIAHFPTQYIIRTWREISLQPCASQALMVHLIGKCAISTWAWVPAIMSKKIKTLQPEKSVWLK